MNIKRWALIVAAGAVILILAAFFVLKGKGIDISITSSDIQSQLDPLFPMTKRELLVLSLTLQNPRVDLPEGGDRIRIGLDAVASVGVELGARPRSGSAEVLAGVSYDPETGNFLLMDPELASLRIDGIPENSTDQVSALASEASSELLDGYVIYTLEATDVATSLARLVLKGVRIEGGVLIVTLGI